MDDSSKKTTAFGLNGEKIARLLSIGREDDLPVVVPEDEHVADLRIEGYEIVEKIAEAGQGLVWRALQQSTGRDVAIKVPRLGSVTSERARIRFEREIELAARLKHPNIARIYDSGVDRGQYYYIMDFVEGSNLDDYVRKHNLTHRQILELMQMICQAVQHAHQNGVIHRDLKPSNIIVADDGRPFIVDFGLAKAILEDEQGPNISVDGETVGTPAYMSPEQAAGRVDEVDTRTDIYSLGVILYNLLTGESPHDLSGSRQQVLRRIADGQIKRPRTVCRGMDKDLEALLLKVLDHDPNRRYSTASGLADDIKNFLDGLPLIAGLPSTTYRLKKFVRRNAALSSAIITAGLTLIIGLVTTTAMYIQANHARAEAQRISDFLQKSITSSLNLRGVEGKEINVRSILDTISEGLQVEFQDQPLFEASILKTLISAYGVLGSYELAESHAKRAIEIYRTQLGPENIASQYSRYQLGWIYMLQSRYSEAEPLLTKALASFQLVLDEEHPDRLYCMAFLGWVYIYQNRFSEAEELFKGALEVAQRTRGTEHSVAPFLMYFWGSAHRIQGRYREAENLYLRGLEIIRRTHNELHDDTLFLKAGLGALYSDMGRYDEAEEFSQAALKGRRKVWDETHQETLWVMAELGWLYHNQGRYKEAEELLCSTLETARQVLAEAHLLSMYAMHGLGTLYLSQNRYDKAELLLAEAFEIARLSLGEDNWFTLRIKNTLARLYTAQSHYEEAEKTFHQVLDGRKLKLGVNHPDTLESKNDLAVLYKKQAQYDKAEPLLVEALEGRRLKLGGTHPHTLESLNNLIDLYEAWDKPEKANEW